MDERLRVAKGSERTSSLLPRGRSHQSRTREVPCSHSQMPPRDRVGRKVHLEAPVEQESVVLVGAHAAYAVRRLEDGDLGSTFSEYLLRR